MGFSLVDEDGSEGADHHTQAAAYAPFLFYTFIGDSFGGAYYFTGRVLTMLTDNGIVGTFYFPDNYAGATMQLGTCIFTIHTAITDIWLN